MNLRLLQLGDSALPIGGYSHSWGLEAAIARGRVSDAATLEAWIRRWLEYAVAPCEGVVVAASCRAAREHRWSQVWQANALLWCTLAPPTLRLASRDMGEQLLGLAEGWPWAAPSMAALREYAAPGPGPRQWHHAPVFATLAAAADSSVAETLAVYLHQAVLGVLGAGVRAVPIGHSHGQQVLTRLHGAIERLTWEYGESTLETAGSFCPAYEVFCHAQSGLYTRLFRS